MTPTVELVAWSGTASQLAMLLNRPITPARLRLISRMGGRSGDHVKIDLTLANTSGLLASLRRRLDERDTPPLESPATPSSGPASFGNLPLA